MLVSTSIRLTKTIMGQVRVHAQRDGSWARWTPYCNRDGDTDRRTGEADVAPGQGRTAALVAAGACESVIGRT